MNMKRMKMHKLSAVILSVALLAGMLGGCGGKDTSKDAQGRTVISVGGWPQKEGTNLDNYNARKERFEKDNPDVVVEPNAWSFDRKSFYAKSAGGQLPTVYGVAYTEMPEIINSEYAADLTAVLKKRGYDDKFNQAVLDVVSKDGKIYAFPNNAYILGIGVNTDLFEKAGLMETDGTPKQPKDWYELAEFAVKIKEATGKAGFVFPSSNNYVGWMFSCLGWSFGVDFMEKDADGKWKATFNTPEAAAALGFIKDLKWKYDVLPSNAIIDGTEYYKTFAVGNAGMLMAAGDLPRNVFQYEMDRNTLGMIAMPAGPKKHVSLLGGTVFCINPNATEDQIDAAVRWIETQTHYNATDEFKTNAEDEMKKQLEEKRLIGVKSMSVWSCAADSLKFEYDLIDKNRNVDENHAKLYNNFVENCPAEIQPEEPVCAQELYGVLDSCIQEVLTNKEADCAALLEKANSDFQQNYLDNLVY